MSKHSCLSPFAPTEAGDHYDGLRRSRCLAGEAGGMEQLPPLPSNVLNPLIPSQRKFGNEGAAVVKERKRPRGDEKESRGAVGERGG